MGESVKEVIDLIETMLADETIGTRAELLDIRAACVVLIGYRATTQLFATYGYGALPRPRVALQARV